MITLGELTAVIGLFTTAAGGVLWFVHRLEKRAKEKEELRQWCKRIDEKLLGLEANDGRLVEELEDVRKDFAQFVRQLLFKK